MRFERRVIIVAALLVASGCEEKTPVEPVDPSTVAAANTYGSGAGTVTQTIAAPEAEQPTDTFAAFDEADWCPRAHEDTVKIVEGMKQTMKLAGKEGEKDEYAPPERGRYIELCQKLPLEMQKCLVVGWATRNRDTCQAALDGLEPDAKTAYGELMGK